MNLDVNSMYPYSIHSDLLKERRMRVLNKKYWPHQVFVDDKQNAERWCYENFKSSEWRNVGRYFAFKQGADATAFALRWA